MNNRLSPFYKNIALWLLITLVMIFLFNYFNSAERTKEALGTIKGFHGKVLFVDLTSQVTRVEHVDELVYRSYLGGYGLEILAQVAFIASVWGSGHA